MLVDFFGHFFDPRRHDMVWDDILELVEPKEREFREDAPFVWNALATREAIITLSEK